MLRYNGDVYFGRMECGMADGYGATVTQNGGTAVLCSRLLFVQLATACLALISLLRKRGCLFWKRTTVCDLVYGETFSVCGLR